MRIIETKKYLEKTSKCYPSTSDEPSPSGSKMSPPAGESSIFQDTAPDSKDQVIKRWKRKKKKEEELFDDVEHTPELPL